MEILYGVLYLHDIFDLRKKFFEAATKNNLSNFPKKYQIWNKACADKVINVVQLLVQSESDGETYCCC